MKINKSIFYSVIILLLFILNNCKKEIGPTDDISCSGQIINENHPKKNAIDAIISDYIKKGLPGISVLIEDSNGIYANAGGFADIENKIAFKTCHISKILLESKLKKVLLLTAIVMIEAECIHQELANLLINLMGIQSFCRFLTRKILEGNFLISQGVLQVCSR